MEETERINGRKLKKNGGRKRKQINGGRNGNK